MKNKTKYLVAILLMLISFLLIGATNVNAKTTDITEINLTGNYQIGKVPAGILPAFNPGTTTANTVIDERNSNWEYKNQWGEWSGFGSETPVAYNDSKTDYGYVFAVYTGTTYQLASGVKVKYNGVDVTSTAKVSSRFPWGNYVYVDLGKAIGKNPPTHTVTFESNGGKEIAPKKVVSGLKIIAPSTPTKDKYLFRGWYEDSTFSKEFDFNTQITSDMTLYAKWEAVNFINEIRLAGDIQYGNVPVGKLPSFNPRTNTTGASINDRNSGWMERKEATPSWQGFGSDTPVANNDGQTDYGYSFAVHVDTEAAYQLASDLQVFYNGEDVTSSADVIPYVWGAYVIVDLGKATVESPATYTVTFNSNGGSKIASKNVNAGEKVSEPTPAPTKKGFTFDGWYEDGTFSKKFNFNTPITDSMTLYAKWTENKYTLKFDANGGSGTMAPKADLTGKYTLPANKFTAPSGKKFKGWSLTTDGAIVTKVDMTENRTVYAIWGNITYSYEFLESTGEQTIDGKANSFKIIIDADETKFVSLKVDGVLYEKDVDYTVKHGSTIIEFTSTGLAKLNALSKGEHNVTVTFTDEVINGKINVTTVNSPIIPQNPDVDNPQNPDVDNPQTYDGIFTHISMFVVSILGLVTTVIIGKKRTRTN